MNVTYVSIAYYLIFSTLDKSVFHSPVVPEGLLYHVFACICYGMFDLPSWAMLLPSSYDVTSESFSWQSWGILPLKRASCSVKKLRSAWGICVHFASIKVFTTSEPLSPWKVPNPVLRISPLRLRPAQDVLCNFPDKLEAKFGTNQENRNPT